MTWDSFLEFMTKFRTDRIVETLAAWHINDLSHNPYFLVGFAILAAIPYFIGWKSISGMIVGLGLMVYVISFAVGAGTGTEGLSGPGIWVLIGGGAAACCLFIYLVFIRSE